MFFDTFRFCFYLLIVTLDPPQISNWNLFIRNHKESYIIIFTFPEIFQIHLHSKIGQVLHTTAADYTCMVRAQLCSETSSETDSRKYWFKKKFPVHPIFLGRLSSKWWYSKAHGGRRRIVTDSCNYGTDHVDAEMTPKKKLSPLFAQFLLCALHRTE
jgi:hypothetical protein